MDSQPRDRLISKQVFIAAALLAFLSGWQTSFAQTPAGNCHPAHRTTCILPYPSDLFTESDSVSPTGKRVVIPDDTFELLRQESADNPVAFTASVRPQQLFQNASGFSAGSPVLFELNQAVDARTLPSEGGSALMVFEIGGAGEPVPVNVQVMKAAQGKRLARKDVIIEAWPRARFDFRKSYVAVLTRSVKSISGTDFHPPSVLADLLTGKPSPLSSAYAPALETLDKQLTLRGLSRADIVDMTFFTVRDESEVVQPIAQFMQRAYSAPHPIRHLSVEYFPFHYVAARVTGQVRLLDFRDADGNMLQDPDYAGTENWVEFRLALPSEVSTEPAPVVLFGHGVTGTKHSNSVENNEIRNAIRNIATLTIDQPNHGDRGKAEGGDFLEILNPAGLSRVIGMVIQSNIDQVSLVAALENELKALNAYPQNKNNDVFPWLALQGEDKKPDLNSARIFYKANSMGGMLGAAFIGASPRLDGAFLQVAGVGIANILSHSAVWSLFEQVAPAQMTGAELAAYLGVVQQGVDYGDGLNFAHYYKTGATLFPYPVAAKPVAVEYGVGDGIVFNNGTHALLEIAGIHLSNPHRAAVDEYYQASPIPQLPDDQLFELGYGAMPLPAPVDLNADESWFLKLITPDINGWTVDNLTAHGAFLTPAGEVYEAAWTESVIQTSPSRREQANQR